MNVLIEGIIIEEDISMKLPIDFQASQEAHLPVPIAMARANLAELVNQAFYAGVTTVIEKRGKPQAVVLSYKTYLLMEKLIEEYEDEFDLKAAQKAIKEHEASGAKSIPIDEFLRRSNLGGKVQARNNSSRGKAVSKNSKQSTTSRTGEALARGEKRATNKSVPRKAKAKN
jgi:prevent-host-death family protein